ncbi:hypothetical protein FPV16_14100 [Methylobacterium sp. W2]|uniref:hypothetical protein n=1 Tax=Methylobacterium sp. W2 TaxID=2598107 RepID=UPI001D0C7BC9|nr:hypothetical protein [Methylobacterium sp. W2]MCC0807353.1 hypothetical protein [Methylobacterium sp. W2]
MVSESARDASEAVIPHSEVKFGRSGCTASRGEGGEKPAKAHGETGAPVGGGPTRHDSAGEAIMTDRVERGIWVGEMLRG